MMIRTAARSVSYASKYDPSELECTHIRIHLVYNGTTFRKERYFGISAKFIDLLSGAPFNFQPGSPDRRLGEHDFS